MKLAVLSVLSALVIMPATAGIAEAVVCKAVGVPKGCIARPAAGATVAHPGVARPGRGVGGVGAPGGGAGVNRVGVGR
jgi:hypothetical protein